jgi:DNA-binding GntR family transcriptional regulator
MLKDVVENETFARRNQIEEQRRTSKADQVYAALKESILSGKIEPGEAIDKIALCDQLGMSRFPVTTAINRLAYERLVVIEPQHGSFVAKIAIEDVREWLMIRRALESEIAAQVALQRPAGFEAELKRNLRYQLAAVEASDAAGLYKLDVEFHRLIGTSLGMTHALEILDGLHSHLERVRRLILTPPGRLPHTYEQHCKIADALLSGDAETARQAMNAHLLNTVELFEGIARQRPNLFSSD